VKQSELRFIYLKLVVSLKRICHLGKLWSLCHQEVKVGGLLRLFMRLQLYYLALIDYCQPLHNGI
jgi:hypothetical protein